MIGDDLDWPAAIPTKAVLEALTHIAAHPHEGVSGVDHFISALRQEVGLEERKPVKVN